MSTSHSCADHEICSVLESIDTPRSLTVWLLFKYGEHGQLVNLEFIPADFNTVSDAKGALCSTFLLKKAKFLSTNIDTRAVAIKKFKAAEAACKRTNQRVLSCTYDYKYTPTILSIAARKIERILGKFNGEEFVNSCEFGPGASTSVKRRFASNPNKYALSKDITPEAYHFVKDWFGEAFPLMGDYFFNIVDSNVVTTVPKNSKTDRVIAIEPDWNIFFQKGLGTMIRRRLKYVGVDLSDQSINQEAAAWGSFLGTLATVDFSSASDMIAVELVRELIPGPWLGCIEALRSRRTRVDDELFCNQKVSSMGNGFTFELESLIFYALASACAEFSEVDGFIGVYGDDIVLPCGLIDTFYSVASDVGFVVNREKSFDSTYFRESCGGYFWNGEDIKPFFLTEDLSDPLSWAAFANHLRLFSTRGLSEGCDKTYRRAWNVIAKNVPKDFPRVPYMLGDTGLIVNFDELATPPKEACRSKGTIGFEGWLVKIVSVRSLEHFCDSRGLLVSRLRSIGLDGSNLAFGNTITLAESTKQTLARSLVPRWANIGEWVYPLPANR